MQVLIHACTVVLSSRSKSRQFILIGKVKKGIYAPKNVEWGLCSDTKVFPEGDASPPSAFTVLPIVIEKSKRTVIIHGRAGFVLIAEGSVTGLLNVWFLAKSKSALKDKDRSSEVGSLFILLSPPLIACSMLF